MVRDLQVKECLSDAVADFRRRGDADSPEFYWHCDPMLPQILNLPEKFPELLQAMLGWAATVGPAGIAGIAVWQGHEDFGDAPDDLVIEISRFHGPYPLPPDPEGRIAAAHGAMLEAARALGCAGPELTDGPGAERRLWRLPRTVPAGAEPGPRWGHAFERRRLLVLRDPVMSAHRMRRGLGAASLVVAFIPDVDEALAAVTRQREAGLPFDFVVVNAALTTEDPAPVIARLREAAGASDLRVVLAGAEERHSGIPGVDRFIRRERPERLMDVLFELLRRRPAAQPFLPPGGAGRSPPAEEEEVPDLVGRHILIVEDVAMNRALLQAMLAPTGATLEVATDGIEAVEAVVARPTDLVLMDIQLPVMDGLEATRRIRAAGLRLPIIALTANARESDRATYLGAGMDGYLAKPIRVDDLYALLRSVLSAKPEA